MTATCSSDAREDRIEHLWLLAIAAAALMGSAWLQFGDDGRLILPVPMTELRLSLIDTCWSRTVLGIPCPGCGLTRSFAAMAHGEFRSAFHFNPMGPILFILCCLQIPYRLGIYFFSGNPRSRLRTMLDRLGIVTWLVAAALLILWGGRLAHHFNILY
jgi:hypothetical protein